MSDIFSHISILFLKVIARLPLKILYSLSDVFYVVVYKLIGYRVEVVRKNLTNSFPNKSIEELRQIEKKFYHHLCDISVETLVKYSNRKNGINNIVDFTNTTEILERYFQKGQSVLLLSFHYNNWELMRSVASVAKHKCFLVYNPQRNLKYDKYINGVRAEFGGIPVPTKRVYRKILESRNIGEKTLTVLIADQTPTKRSKFWTLFLNQETAFFPGPGRLAKSFPDHPVLFYYFEKLNRGRYKLKIEPLIEDPSKFTENEIIKIYAGKIESIIKENPEYYLWSHRRWKHKRPENMKLI